MNFNQFSPEQRLSDMTTNMVLSDQRLRSQMPELSDGKAQQNLRDAFAKIEDLAYQSEFNQGDTVYLGGAQGPQMIKDGAMVPLKDGPGDFTARSLERFDFRPRDQKLRLLNYDQLLPVNVLSDPAITAETYQMDRYVINDDEQYSEHGQKTNEVEILSEEFTSPVKREDVGFTVTRDEMLAMARTGRINMVSRKVKAGYRAYRQKCHRRFLTGDTLQGVNGFINHAALPGIAINLNTKTTIALMTIPEKVAYLNSLISSVFTSTYQNHSPDTLALAPAIWSDLFNNVADFTYQKAITLLFDELGGMGYKEVISCHELTASSLTGKDQLIAYEKSDENMEATIVEDLIWLPEQMEGSSMRFTGTFKLGTFKYYYPMSGLRAYEQ